MRYLFAFLVYLEQVLSNRDSKKVKFSKVTRNLSYEIQPRPMLTCSKSTIETPEQCVKSVQSHWRFGVFINNFEHIPHIFQAFVFLT